MDALFGDGDAVLAESPLLESPAELEAVLRQVAGGITVQDPNGVLVYANDAAARLIGFSSSEELMATPVDEVTSRFEMYDESGEPFPVDRLPGRLALRGIQSEQVIGYRTRGSSAERWSLVTSSPIFDESGHLRFAVNAFQDITSHKRAEERLRMLADAGELLASPVGVMETLAQVPQLVVPRLADASSVWVEEAGTLRRLATAATPEHLELYEQLPKTYDLVEDAHVPVIEMYRRGEALFIPEVPAETPVHAAGRTAESELVERLGVRAVMAVPLRGQDRSIGLLTFSAFTPDRFREIDFEFARELAARVAAAIEREQRAQAAEALAFTAEGVCLLDVDGRVRLWNPAAVAITGIAERDIVGKRLLDVIPAWARVQDPAPGASAHVVPVEIAGVEHWLSVSTARFEGGTVHAFRDLTQERALEQLKSDFISTISHELRTPLAAIYGASMTLQRADLDAAAVRKDELLQVISNEADRLARTINDVLWASRLESGTLQVRIESCDGGRLAEAVVAAQRTHLPSNLHLELDVGSPLPRVAADPDKVRQVLSNLVDNAVKYSPDGGEIRVAVQRIGRYVRFAVRDSGLGIPPAEQERVFEKFYRLDPNLTRGVSGTGLGLYICRELVHRMDGRVSVKSGAGKGSTFVVELPVAAAH
jgi:PAS domain S-box-containing protein